MSSPDEMLRAQLFKLQPVIGYGDFCGRAPLAFTDVATVQPPPTTAHVVIAHYSEPIEPLMDVCAVSFAGAHVFVYTKGPARLDRRTLERPGIGISLIALPNVGREGHTYLHHIIAHYSCLPDKLVFLPGSVQLDDGKRGTLEAIVSSPAPCFGPWCFSEPWGAMKTFGLGHYSSRYNGITAPLQPARVAPFGAWLQHVLGVTLPDSEVWTNNYGGVFSTRREEVYHHPLDTYRRLLAELSHSSNPAEGHYMERLWVWLLGPAFSPPAVRAKHPF